MKKLFIVFLILIITFNCTQTVTFAEENVGASARSNNVSDTYTNFTITNGVANVYVNYSGFEGITTNARITIKIQKRFLFFFWQDVDGAEWVDISNEVYYSNSHSISVKSGTYRAQIEYVIYGTGGVADTITETIEASYWFVIYII